LALVGACEGKAVVGCVGDDVVGDLEGLLDDGERDGLSVGEYVGEHVSISVTLRQRVSPPHCKHLAGGTHLSVHDVHASSLPSSLNARFGLCCGL